MTTDTHKMIIRIIDCLVKKNVYQEKWSLKCDSEPLKQTILVPEQVPPGLLPAKFVAIENWKGHGVERSRRPPVNVHLELEPLTPSLLSSMFFEPLNGLQQPRVASRLATTSG